MLARIFSPVVCNGKHAALAATMTLMLPSVVSAESGYYTDDATGIVYQKVTRTVDRPVVETKVEQREKTVYRPQTVTETTPQARTVYTPVVEYNWVPKVHGRWNPFQRPTIAYHHVPQTRWEAQNEVVQRTQTRTEWVAEKRTVEVPHRIVRMEREQKVDYQPIGRVAPSAGNGAASAIASRLRPIDSRTQIAPLGSVSAPRVAARSVGRMASDPPRRTTGQGGIRATELNRYGGATSSGGTMATLPAPPVFR